MIMSPDTLLAIALGIGLAAAVGLRIFLPLLLLSVAARMGWVSLSVDFSWLAGSAALITLTVASVVEVAAYYVPGLDHALDVIAAPLALAAGALVMAAVVTDLPPHVKWAVAIIAGAGAAGLTQVTSTAVRAKSGLLSAGLANPLVATAELGGAAGLSLLAIFLPVAALFVVVLLVMLLWRMKRALLPARSKGAP
jgi:hypothetical protein